MRQPLMVRPKKLFSLRKDRHAERQQQKEQEARRSRAVTEEQEGLMSQLKKYALLHFGLEIEFERVRALLQYNDWDLKRAMTDLDDCQAAHVGLLHAPPTASQTLLGCENDGGTSCYIDALLFAMYITLTAFDPLLTCEVSPDQVAKRKLQISLRLFINVMRQGRLVRQHMVARLRQALQDAAWHGRNPRTGRWSQEDASELLLFLTETFDLPYLPFQTRLFHGASRDVDDDRVTTDRVLSLPIPPGSSRNIQLESILFDHFYDSIVTGVRRVVEPSSPTSMSSSPPTKKQAFLDDMEGEGVAVNAWQVLELLPFYSGMNEQGELIESQNRGSFPDSRMVLPIILKRYQFNDRGSYVKDQRRVQVPASMQFNQFLNRNAGQPICDTCGQKVEGVMRLRSAVCHKGSTPTSGHYVAYACTKEGDTWFKLDDMAKTQRVTTIPDERAIFDELSKEGYLFFYELDKPCKHTRDETRNTAALGRRPSTDAGKAHREPSLLEEVYHTIPTSISSSNRSQKKHKKRRRGPCKIM